MLNLVWYYLIARLSSTCKIGKISWKTIIFIYGPYERECGERVVLFVIFTAAAQGRFINGLISQFCKQKDKVGFVCSRCYFQIQAKN